MISPRTNGYVHQPTRAHDGWSFRYSRTIYGTPYSFTVVTMPNGERRYAVDRYNGYGDNGTAWGRKIGMQFGCAWTPVHFITVKAKGQQP